MEALGETVSLPSDGPMTRQRRNKSSILLELSHFLASSLDLECNLQGALSLLLDHFGFEGGRIYLMDPEGTCLRLAARSGVEPTELETVTLDEGFSEETGSTRSPVAGRVIEVGDRDRVTLLLGKDCETIVCVPLIALDDVVGVMRLATKEVIELDRNKIELLVIVGNQIATAVNNARLYTDIRQKIGELEEKKETIKFFAYSVSHDLKCPAVGLQGLAERLKDKYAESLGEKGKELCNQILKTSKHILALSNKINAYIATKESPLRIERVRLKEITEIVRNEFASLLEERSIRWSEPSEEVEIEADRTALIRFFQNCVDNSLKYGGDRMTEIRLGHAEGRHAHILSVRDDGVGMRQEDGDLAFELFQRRETSNGVDGSGLGLAIVKELANRHGGRVWVKTDEGKGATFFLSIPKRSVSPENHRSDAGRSCCHVLPGESRP